MNSDFSVTMAEVLPLLGISYPPDRRSFYMKCPCCDDTKKHLNINLEVNAFRCPRCGFGGGVLDLYAFYNKTDRRQAYVDIRDRLKIDDRNKTPSRRIVKPKSTYIECPLMDVETRNETYTAFLSKLTLATDHHENLRNRGLSDEAIFRNMYRTMPVIGHKSIATNLQKDGLYLAGVPGFHKDKNGSWCVKDEKRGILIPVRDCNGRIQALHVRLDDTSDGKFRWFSSAGRIMGCSAGSPVHFAGEPQKTVILTEGAMKADIVHCLTGRSIISVQGVNALKTLAAALELLKGRGVEKIMTAFDIDYMTNPNVQKSMMQLYWLLNRFGFCFGTYIWPPEYKGIDDYERAKALQMVE